jgi:hypothetical protein
MISLAEAEKQTKIAAAEILRKAAAGEIVLAKWAHNWPAVQGKLGENGQFVVPQNSDILLREKWVYVDRGYLQQFIDSPGMAVPMGTWRSTADGPVDLFVGNPNKPVIQLSALYLRADDVERLKAMAPAEVPKEDPHQVLIAEVKATFWNNWQSHMPRPLAKKTQEYIRNRARELGIPLSENAVKQIDSLARPPHIREAFRRR